MSKIKFGRWYVVELSLRKGNPNHKAIAQCILEEPAIVQIVSYEVKRNVTINTIPFFRVISEIKEMA